MKDIQQKFKIKEDKIESPDMYLGAGLMNMNNKTNKECWEIQSDQYCAVAVVNVTEALNKKSLRLPSKFVTLLANDYRTEVDVTPALKVDELHYYQELIGVLRWAIEIGILDIFLEVIKCLLT